MTDLEKLQDALRYVPECRKDTIRGIAREAHGLNHYGSTSPHLVHAINQMWDLVCDCAETNIKATIRSEAQRMKEAAERALM